MPRDFPDWGQFPEFTAATVYEISGETAARLGSPQLLFRDGLLAFADDFRHGLGAWDSSGSGATSALLLASSPRWHGGSPYVAQLSVGAVAGETAQMRIQVPFPDTTGLGVIVVFRDDADELKVDATITVNGRRLRAGAWLNAVPLQLRTGVSTYAPIVPAIDVITGVPAAVWKAVKLVVNIPSERYARVQTNGADVTPISPSPGAGAGLPVNWCDLTVHADQVGAVSAFVTEIGLVAITYDEPL